MTTPKNKGGQCHRRKSSRRQGFVKFPKGRRVKLGKISFFFV